MSTIACTPFHPLQRQEDLKHNESTSVHPSYDRQLSTRNKCVAGLIASFFFGIALIGLCICSSTILRSRLDDHYLESYFVLWNFSGITYAPDRLFEPVTLLVNIILTFLIESIAFIHTASLRWTLLREGRLSFNSNLRLFSSTQGFGPNAWYTNLIFILATVIAYSSAALSITLLPNSPGGGTWIGSGKLALCIVPAVFLGVSVLIMASIATWSLLKTSIPTWSSSPLHTVLAAKAEIGLEHRPSRSMLGVLDAKKASEPVTPKTEQPNALKSRLSVPLIVVMLVQVDWILLAVSSGLLARWLNSDTGGYWDSEPMSVTISGSRKGTHVYAMILLFAAIQSPITLCLHAIELLVNVLRDEKCWRSAASDKGCALGTYDSITAACTNWLTILLFFAKAVIHTLFGMTAAGYEPDANMSGGWFDGSGDNVLLSWRPWPSLVLAHVLNVVILVFILSSSRSKKGPQPAAYGHLQTLANLIDDWSPTLFWGHKHDGSPCRAGTSKKPLPNIHMDAVYS